MQPSAASMSEFDATTYGAVVAATPRLMFAPKPSVVSFRMTRARACRRVAAGVGDEHELVDLRRERLEARSRVGVAGRPDHDRGDGAHTSSR